MKYSFTKPRFRLKFSGLAGKIYASQISSKTNCFLRRLFLHKKKTKNIQTKPINNVYLTHSVVAYLGLLGDTLIANIHIAIWM